MTGLPKSIIKKYGVTKKAWSVFRGRKGQKRGVTNMAKGKKHSGRKNGGMMSAMFGAALYGAARQYLSDKLAPLTSKIPLGGISDEVGLIGLAWLGKKFLGNRIPVVSSVAKAGMLIEAARIGEAVATGQLGNLGMLGSTSQQGLTVYA